MTLADRLSQRMQQCGISQAELGRRVGLSQQAIGKLVRGDARSSTHLHKIARELETTPAYLLGETDDPVAIVMFPPTHEEIAEELGLMKLPEIDIAVGMGAGYVDEPVIEGTDRWMPVEWVRQFTDAPAARLAIIRPRGDSMYPTINDRDIVLIDRGEQRIEEQDLIWTLVYGGLRTIRRVRAMPDGTYKLMGDNQAVREETAHDNEMFVIGRVVGVVRRL